MQGVLTAMLPLLGVLVGAGLQYVFGRSLDVRRQVEASKAQAYSDYLQTFANIATTGRSKDALAKLADAKTRICVYGSPTVLKLLADFERAGAATEMGQNRELVSRLIMAMRKDVRSVAAANSQEELASILFGQAGKVQQEQAKR
jgi:hypothetical protein